MISKNLYVLTPVEQQEPMFYVWCDTKDGRSIRMGNGEPLTEKQADKFAWAHRGGAGTDVGNTYTVRPADWLPDGEMPCVEETSNKETEEI